MRKEPFNTPRLNEPFVESRQISDNLVETQEVTERQTRITFFSGQETNLEYVEHIFKHGLQVDPGQIANVSLTETVVTTFTRSKKA